MKNRIMESRKFTRTKALLCAAMLIPGTLGGLTGCGSGSSGIGAGTYTYAYRAIEGNTCEPGAYNFSKDITSYWRALDITLTLNDDGTFSMETNVYMVEDTEGSSLEVGEKFPYGDGMYQESYTNASGTWTSTGDTVTISADYVEYELPDQGASYFVWDTSTMGYNDMSESDSYVGEWNSDDVAEVLNLVPDTTFFIDDDTISCFIEAGYVHSIKSDDGAMYFYGDSVYVRDTANLSGASYTYSISDGTLTVTESTITQDSDGNYVTETTDYTAAAGETLEIGDFSITISEEDIEALS